VAEDPPEVDVLGRFLKDGRLTVIPAKAAKRRLVLDHLAQMFEPGRRYPEAEVNALLQRVHPDTAALRRYLVDEGFMARADGVYWRIGGSLEVD
jgi:hypothetical protein